MLLPLGILGQWRHRTETASLVEVDWNPVSLIGLALTKESYLSCSPQYERGTHTRMVYHVTIWIEKWNNFTITFKAMLVNLATSISVMRYIIVKLDTDHGGAAHPQLSLRFVHPVCLQGDHPATAVDIASRGPGTNISLNTTWSCAGHSLSMKSL